MKIRDCIILSAGLGTRMGEIGKFLPKPLWPLFSKTLIETKVLEAKRLGVENIHVNLFHHADVIKRSLQKSHPDVNIVIEESLLGVGGGIHNIVQFTKKKELLVLNSDQIFDFSLVNFSDCLERLSNCRALLFGMKVDNFYNKLVLENNILKRIVKGVEGGDYITYTGNSIVNLEGLKPIAGPSDFFETVADFKSESVIVDTVERIKYFDFGTSDLYYRSLVGLFDKLASEQDDSFSKYLAGLGFWNSDLADYQKRSYNCEGSNVLNFSGVQTSLSSNDPIVLLSNVEDEKLQGAGIYFKNLYQKC